MTAGEWLITFFTHTQASNRLLLYFVFTEMQTRIKAAQSSVLRNSQGLGAGVVHQALLLE